MKKLLSLLLSLLFLQFSSFAASNKTTLMVETNGTLVQPADFFAANSNLMNASVHSTGGGSGSGLTNVFNPAQFTTVLGTNINGAVGAYFTNVQNYGTLSLTSAIPRLSLYDTSGSADNKRWDIYSGTDRMAISLYKDDFSSGAPAMEFFRSSGDVFDYAKVRGGLTVDTSGITNNGIVVGKGSGTRSVVLGLSLTSSTDTIAIGNGAVASFGRNIAIGISADSSGNNASLSVGAFSHAAHNAASSFGVNASTTAPHQIMLGTASEGVEIPGTCHVTGNFTNSADIYMTGLSTQKVLQIDASGKIGTTTVAGSSPPTFDATQFGGAAGGTNILDGVILTNAVLRASTVATNLIAWTNTLTKTASYTVTTNDNTVFCDPTSVTNLVITLPSAVVMPGRFLNFIRTTSVGTNLVSITNSSSQTIGGATRYVLFTQNDSVQLVSDGSNWQIATPPVPVIVLTNDVSSFTTNTTAAQFTYFSYTVPFGTMVTGKAIHIIVAGTYLNNSGGNRTTDWVINIGGNTIWADTSVSSGAAAGRKNLIWDVWILPTGDTAQSIYGYYSLSTATAATTGTGDLAGSSAADKTGTIQGSATVNTSTNLTISFLGTMSTSHASLEHKRDYGRVTIDR